MVCRQEPQRTTGVVVKLLSKLVGLRRSSKLKGAPSFRVGGGVALGARCGFP